MVDDKDAILLPFAELLRLVEVVLTSNGVQVVQASAMADVIVRAQADGAHSHGIYRLEGCVNAIRSGKVDPSADPIVLPARGAIVEVDAKGGFAPAALVVGRHALMDCTRQYGIGMLAIRDCYHFSALWADVEPLADKGFVAIALTLGVNSVAIAGGHRPAIGTNPMAFAFPRGEGLFPFVFDQSSSVVARGEVELRMLAGQQLPEGWAVDRAGVPTVEPAAALDGAILPFGGHKGSAIGIMIELLAGPLIGQLSSKAALERDTRDGGPLLGGYVMIAIDPLAFATGGVNVHAADTWLRELSRENPAARLPSSRRQEARRKSEANGIPISASSYAQLTGLKGS